MTQQNYNMQDYMQHQAAQASGATANILTFSEK